MAAENPFDAHRARIERAIEKQWEGGKHCPTCNAEPGEPCDMEIPDPKPYPCCGAPEGSNHSGGIRCHLRDLMLDVLDRGATAPQTNWERARQRAAVLEDLVEHVYEITAADPRRSAGDNDAAKLRQWIRDFRSEVLQ